MLHNLHIVKFFYPCIKCVAILPRMVILLAVTVIFIISPVDIIPDALPLIGVMDDTALTIFSFMATKNALEVKNEK